MVSVVHHNLSSIGRKNVHKILAKEIKNNPFHKMLHMAEGEIKHPKPFFLPIIKYNKLKNKNKKLHIEISGGNSIFQKVESNVKSLDECQHVSMKASWLSAIYMCLSDLLSDTKAVVAACVLSTLSKLCIYTEIGEYALQEL